MRSIDGTERGAAPRGGSGAMFDAIADRYDTLNRILSFGIDRRWRRRAVEALGLDAAERGALGSTARALDLATGTGDLAIAIARRHRDVAVVGVDPSPKMLAVGRQKVAREGLTERVTLEEGDAERLRFEDASFDAVSIAFGIRNVPDRSAALREMGRVTRPGGRIAILELSEPRGGVLGPLARLHVHTIVPALGAALSGAAEYRYLQRSIAAFPPAGAFAEQMRDAGLDVVAVTALTFGVAHLYIARPKAPGR